jgi:putative endonuclease
VYILTNAYKNVLYIGVTNDVERRIEEHRLDGLGPKLTFAGKYNCFYLVYWERHQHIQQAIEREKQLKGWKRDKKDALIASFNPEWKFLNESYYP